MPSKKKAVIYSKYQELKALHCSKTLPAIVQKLEKAQEKEESHVQHHLRKDRNLYPSRRYIIVCGISGDSIRILGSSWDAHCRADDSHTSLAHKASRLHLQPTHSLSRCSHIAR